MLNFSYKHRDGESNKQSFSDKRLNEFDQTLQECAEILKNNLDKTSDSNRQIVYNQLK